MIRCFPFLLLAVAGVSFGLFVLSVSLDWFAVQDRPLIEATGDEGEMFYVEGGEWDGSIMFLGQYCKPLQPVIDGILHNACGWGMWTGDKCECVSDHGVPIYNVKDYRDSAERVDNLEKRIEALEGTCGRVVTR